MQTFAASACYRCRARLDEADFRSGSALQIGSLASCTACADDLLARLTREQRRAVLQQAAALAGDDAPKTPRTLLRTAAASAPNRNPSVTSLARRPRVVSAALAAAAALLLAVFLASIPPRNPAAVAKKAAAPRPVAVPPTPQPLVPVPAATDRAREDLLAAIAALESEVRETADRGQFQASLDRLEAARRRRDGFEWSQAVDRLAREARDAVEGRYVRLKPLALEAQRRGDPGALKRARDEVASWNVARHIDDLEKALGAPEARLGAGLVGWWTLDDAGGGSVEDASGGGLHGTRTGGASPCDGRHGGALSFSGTDGVIQAPAPPVSGPLTVAAWIRPASLPGDRALLGESGRYALKLYGDALRFTTPGIKDHDCPARIAAGAWQHVAVTFQPGAPGGAVFYRNGRRLGAVDASRLGGGSSRFLIGQNQWGASQAFHGAIADVRVYNRALPPEDILAVFAGPVAPSPP